jgi:glucose-6-phosphate isomerase
MYIIKFDCKNVFPFVSVREMEEAYISNRNRIKSVLCPTIDKQNALGWIDINIAFDEELLEYIEKKAEEIRKKSDIFVLIGVGGSNQGARAAIEALGDNKVKVLYCGNTLSPNSIAKIMAQLKGKSVFVNIIAKNFATLEPGVIFRVIRHYMEETYGPEEAAKRIIATGSLNNGSLEMLGRKKGYALLPFPPDVEGRFSVLSAVGLLPIAVAGIDIRDLLNGAAAIRNIIRQEPPERNMALNYALCRSTLLKKGYTIEILSCFEPLLDYFSKWWIQLFGESEGKDGKGIFPVACSFSEDLHSLGQYIQEGRRIIFETFLNLEDQGSSFMIPHEDVNSDGFAYVEGKDLSYINKVAYEATLKAHVAGGVPCMTINIPKLSAYYMGQLFYFFEYACYISATLLGVNPFDQPGVEAYKKNMFKALGRDNY